MRADEAYAELVKRTREESLLASCIDLLGWDEDTYMPPGGSEHRAAQIGFLAGLLHDRATDPRLGELLHGIEGSPLVEDPDSVEAVNVREIRRAYDRDNRLPRALVEEIARVTSLGEHHWAEARQESNFRAFQPWLEKIVALAREEAEALGYRECPYDALLDLHDPGLTAARVAEMFDALRRELIHLVNELTYARRKPKVGILRRSYPVQRQYRFGMQAAAALGFDFRRGRLDTTTHPFFTTLGPHDCRITTRFAEHSFGDGLFAILHETGHGLYEQGLPVERHGTPAGEVMSLSLHESQARLWENTVGRSRPFWVHFFPEARELFPEALAGVPLDEFHFAVNAVEPTFIRIHADEVTYNLHILVRFELERALLRGDLKVSDVPGAWNEAYRHYLGIVPSSDAEGCLQDGHWGSGMIGYFPTYTLGNLMAAQLYETAERELGDVGRSFARGDFQPLLDWLRQNVYRHGGRWPAGRLIEQVTGDKLNQRPLLEALRRKYVPLYGL